MKYHDMRQDWQLVTQDWCCLIVLDRSGIIRMAAPLLRRFIGQHSDNLVRWTQRSWPWFRWHQLTTGASHERESNSY